MARSSLFLDRRRRGWGTAPGTHPPGFGLSGLGDGARAGVSAKIVVGQFEAGVGCGFRGGGQFVRAQRGPLLDADTVGQEQSEIRGYRVVDSRLPAGNAVKLVGTRVLLLVESHVPQFHRSLPALTFAGDPWGHDRDGKLFSDRGRRAVGGGEIVLGGIVSFVVLARAIVDEDRLSVFAEDRQAIFAK